MKRNRIPPNTAELQTLRNNGWNVRIKHYRQMYHLDNPKRKIVIPDWDVRYNGDYWIYDLSPTGGATEMTLQNGEQKITVRADVFHKDRFARRLGVKECLKKFYKIKSGE